MPGKKSQKIKKVNKNKPTDSKETGLQGKAEKPFQQFSNPNKFGGGGKQSPKTFHRRSGK